MAEDKPAQPALRVVNADATPEEVAAIVAVLSAMSGGEAPPAPRRPQWSHPGRMHRQPVAHGVGGWRASGLPR